MIYVTERQPSGEWAVLDENRMFICRSPSERETHLIAESLTLLDRLVGQFKGLVCGDDEVNGSDLVQELSSLIAHSPTISAYHDENGTAWVHWKPETLPTARMSRPR